MVQTATSGLLDFDDGDEDDGAMSSSDELQRAVLHGQAAAVQALLLAPLIEGTVEELERKRASRVEPEARLRAAERALVDGNAAEKEAIKARVAAEDLYNSIQSEGTEWIEQHAMEQERNAGSPRSHAAPSEDVVFATADSPHVLTAEQIEVARLRKVRSAQTFASPLAVRADLPAPWEPLLQSDSRLSVEKQEEVRSQARADLEAKAATGEASKAELAQLRQHHWVHDMDQLKHQRIGRVLYDPDAVRSLYDVQNTPPWVRETKELLRKWAHVHHPDEAQSREWPGKKNVPAEVTKALFEGLAEVGPKDTGCESWQSEVRWVIEMLTAATSRRGKRSGGRGSARRSMGLARSTDELKHVFFSIDRNRDGEMSRAELILRLRKDSELAAMLDLPSHIKDGDREDFEALFQGMDSDSSGNVDCDEFVRHFSCGISGQQLAGGCSLESILNELLVLGRATACLPAQFSQAQLAEYVERVLEPLKSLKWHGWFHRTTMAAIARARSSEVHLILKTARQVECDHADEVEDATDDIEQYKEQLEEINDEIAELEDRIALYRGPIDGIRGRLREHVCAADGDYTGFGDSAGCNYRLQDVALNGTSIRTPVPGSSLVLVAAWRGHLEVLKVLLALQADPNRAATDGSTPLYMAAGTGRADIVAALLTAGAEPGRIKPGGLSPLWNAAMQREHGGTRTPWPQDGHTSSPIEWGNIKRPLSENSQLRLCSSEYRNSFAVRESTRLLASQIGARPKPRNSSDPSSLASVEALLSLGQHKVDAARAHRDTIAQKMVLDLNVFTSMSNDLAKMRDRKAEMIAICNQLQTELEELKATAVADEEDSDGEDIEVQLLENRPSARRKLRSAVIATTLGAGSQRRRGRSPDPGERERARAPKKSAQEIRQKWRVSAALGSEFSRRARSPDPMDRSDALWTAAAAASAQRHFRVWICETCGKRRIPVDMSECPLCGKEKPSEPDPCPDFDNWKRVVDDDSGLPYWFDVTGKKESTWDPPPGWEDEFYRRTSLVKPKSRESRQLAKREARTEKLAAQVVAATPRPQVSAEDMARLAAVFMTVDADGSGTVSPRELADALWKDSGLAKMLNMPELLVSETKHLADESDAKLTREASIKLLFEAMDRNKDGSVSKEEFMGFVASGNAQRAAGGGLGWQILRQKMPWVIEAEKLVEEWVGVVYKDGDGLVGKQEAKSMLRALAEFRAFYAAALLKEAGMERESKRGAGILKDQDQQQQQQQQQQQKMPEPEEPVPEPEEESGLAEEQGAHSKNASSDKSNQLFSSINRTRQKRRVRNHILSAMFQQADTNGDGNISRSELIRSLRRNPKMATVLDLPEKITDQERAAFERVFQAMDRDDDRAINEKEFLKFFSTGKAAAAAFKLGAGQRQAPAGIEGAGEDWEWADLLEELDQDNDGQLSVKELMGLFVDIDPKNYQLYTTCVLKPLYELKHNGWFDPVEMTKLCLKRLGQADSELRDRQIRMQKAEQHCTEATQQVQRTAKQLADADKVVSAALQYLGEYLNFAVDGVTVLHIAADRGDMPLLLMLLQTDSLDVDKAKVSGATALHCAAANGHLEAVQALLDAGAQLDVLDGSGRSASDRARQSGLAEAGEVETLLTAARLQRQFADTPEKT
eukprot:COSAG02_NODE_66_length_42609_cov_95.996848_15_plen_1632_part_00